MVQLRLSPPGRPAISLPALLAVLLWGAVVPLSKLALADFPALAFATLRPLLAAALLFAWLAGRRERLLVERREWPKVLLAGLAGMGVFQFFTFVGLRFTSATHSVLIYAASPVLGVALLWAARQARLAAGTLLGVLLGFAGVAILVLGGQTDAGTATPFGDALTLIGALGWVGVTVLPQPLVRAHGAVFVTAWLDLLAGLAILPFALPEIAAVVVAPPPTATWLGLLYSAVLGMIVANALWQRAVRALGPAQTLVYVYLEPLLAVLLAVVLLGERLDAVQAVGALALLAGVGLAQRGAAA